MLWPYAFNELLLQSPVLRIECIYTNLLHIIHIPVCSCVRLCFPSTLQLIFIMDAHGVPCEVAAKSRNVKCLMETVLLGHFLTLFSFSLVIIVPPVPQIYLCFHATHIRRTSWRFLETLKESNVLLDVGEYWLTTFKIFLIFKWWATLSVLHGS